MHSKISTTTSESGCSKGCGLGLDKCSCVRFGKRSPFVTSGSRSSDSEQDSSSCSDGSSGNNPRKSGQRKHVSRGVSTSTMRLTDCCSGDCHGCCHGDCGCYGNFGYHDDHGRNGEVYEMEFNGNRNKSEASLKWQTMFSGGNRAEVSEEALSLACKLKFEILRFKEWLGFSEYKGRNGFSFGFCDMVFSFLEVVNKAVGMLEHQEVVEEELFVAQQLLQLQKARNRRLQEDNLQLEIQLRETNKDYGQLLVQLDTKDETLRVKLSTKREALLDKSCETEQLGLVHVGTQTEICGKKDMAVQAAEDGNCDPPLESNEGNCCEVSLEGSVTSKQVDYCEESEPFQTKDFEATARDDFQQESCLPNKSQSNDGKSQSSSENDAAPLLREQTKEHAGEQNTEGSSVTSITWPCDHYKRLCLVKFACCEKFYPCHRCHNKTGECSVKKLRSVDAKFLKCLACNEVQNFTETSQNCVKCGIEFAKYFCRFCQHLTGTDDKPFHCLKCGICRVNSDRSFHCDDCGVCLDLQLRGNHVCRTDSAHDPCCICLEDAFSGCQILPCGHKIHKDCATLMIRNGMRCCPVCRQSFAHRLQRVPKSEK